VHTGAAVLLHATAAAVAVAPCMLLCPRWLALLLRSWLGGWSSGLLRNDGFVPLPCCPNSRVMVHCPKAWTFASICPLKPLVRGERKKRREKGGGETQPEAFLIVLRPHDC
jgi:hypothetical protein